MKIEWLKTGAAAHVVLADDAQRHTIIIDEWSAAAAVQQEPLIGAAHPFQQPRGNVAGVFSFRSTKSHTTLDAAVEAYHGEVARAGERGQLKITTINKVITYTALLAAVQRGQKEGVRQEIAYQFLTTSSTLT